jgi:Tol biopolymer transport system component
MQRRRSITWGLLAALALLLIASGAQADRPSRPLQDETPGPVVVQIHSLLEPREPLSFSGPPRGIRTYGKGAVRQDLPAIAVGESKPGAIESGGSIDASTNKISGTPMAGSVAAFSVSPDGTTAVFIADKDTVLRFELYSVPVDGLAAPTKISDGLPFGVGDQGVRAFQITPDSTQVVFLADPNAGGGSDDIFSVPIDGSGAPVQLNAATARPVTGLGITPDSGSAVFFGVDSVFAAGTVEVYSASIGTAASATQISDVGQTNLAGAVVAADFSPNSATVLYAADALSDNLFQWFSVPTDADGTGFDVQLSTAIGSVGPIVVTPDSSTIVYLADENVVNKRAVLQRPIGGGAKTQLNPALAGGGAVFVTISPDGSRVGYLADQDTAGVTEVYSAVLGSSGSGTRLNMPMSGNQFADTLNISPDSGTVLYEADQETAGTVELFGAPIDATANPSTLHGLTSPDDAGFFAGLGTPIVGSRAVYTVLGASATDLYNVPFDGSGPFAQINATPAAGDTVLNAFVPMNGATWLMAYGVGPDTGALTDELNVVPIRGDLAPEQINATAASDTFGVLRYEITSDENYGVYLQDQDTLGKPELYSRELDSDGDTVINRDDNCRFVPNSTQGDAVFPQTVLANDGTTFGWTAATDVRFVRGPLEMVSVLATDDSGTLTDAMSYTDASTPAAGAGFYYLFAPDCSARSWQTVEGAEPPRDSAGFP